jgi:hypothetical protein
VETAQLSRYVAGGFFVLVIAAGFEFELATVFIAGLLLFGAWALFMLFRADD